MITYKPTYNQSYIQDYFPDYKPPEIKGYKKQFSIETPRGEDTEIPTIDLLEEDPIKDSESPSSKIYNDNKEFISDLESAYTKELTRRGLNPEYAKYLVAQDALETNYGKSYKGNFNFGNITVGSSGASYTEGKDKDSSGNTITQKFRNYNSLDDYVSNKINLLSGSRYKAFNGDLSSFYDRVKRGGYAEDANYVSKLNGVYNSIYKAKNGIKLPEMPWFLK